MIRASKGHADIFVVALLLAVASVGMLSGCARDDVRGSAPVPESTRSIGGQWAYEPTSATPGSMSLHIDVTQTGRFAGVATYGEGLKTAGDVTGTISAGVLWNGGVLKARHSGSRDLQLKATWDRSGHLTFWRTDVPDLKMRMMRVSP